jgi:hypothetical protein
LGVTIVALLNWLRAFLIGLLGAVLIVAGHLSGHLITAIGGGDFVQRLLSTVGKTLGLSALVLAVVWLAAGIGL